MARPERFELPTAWFVARLYNFTYFMNQSLAVLAHPIPYLSYQSLVLQWQFKLAQNQHIPLRHLSRLYFQMYSFSLLQVTDNTEQVTGLRIPFRAEHAHQAFARLTKNLG